MSLIKSISGIRGTIGGKPGESLTPVDIVKFTAAYGTWLQRTTGKQKLRVIVGRDARRSGPMVNAFVINTLAGLGIDVTDIGMASTPTVEVAVTGACADGGIIITASHNPAQWNALKLVNGKGEFLSAADGETVLAIAASEDFIFADIDSRGVPVTDNSWTTKHIDLVLALDYVDVEAIARRNFTVAIDCVNSVGGLILTELLSRLGVKKIVELNTLADGNFAHNPEPLPENLGDISELVVSSAADLGIVVDPDVDRLALVCEDGTMFGEEYTLVSVSDYVLGFNAGSTVSNMSSTKALKDVTHWHKCEHYSSAVGEVNVVEEMKLRGAVIGGEGNGGVIYPALHYGRDALVGIALFLSQLAKSGLSCSGLRKKYPDYTIAKKKTVLEEGADYAAILSAVKESYKGFRIDERDGLWIGLEKGWVQVRKSNTEPIIRIYAEAPTAEEAAEYADAVIGIVKKQKK